MVLEPLATCSIPDKERWHFAYERIVGGAACLLAAYPTFVRRTSTIMRDYHDRIRIRLPELLRNACKAPPHVNWLASPLKWWSCGLFFNTAIARIANALEKTVVAACLPHDERHGKSPFSRARCICAQIVRDTSEGFQALSAFAEVPLPENIDHVVTKQVDELFGGIDLKRGLTEVSQELNSRQPERFRSAAITFMWRDANAQKHRAKRSRGGQDSSEKERDPRVQFMLVLRSFEALCAVYSRLRSDEDLR